MKRINPVELFSSLDIPIGYFVNPRPGKVPFMVYFGIGASTLNADNKVYNSSQNWALEVYTTKKDIELENKIEKILNDNEIVWTKGAEIYLNDDKVFLTPYYF